MKLQGPVLRLTIFVDEFDQWAPQAAVYRDRAPRAHRQPSRGDRATWTGGLRRVQPHPHSSSTPAWHPEPHQRGLLVAGRVEPGVARRGPRGRIGGTPLPGPAAQ